MEDLWKKFKEETQEQMQKINEFLDEKSSSKKSHDETIKNETSKVNEQIKQIVLDETTEASRKDIYGKLKDMVRDIMEKEHVSRAQAYRKAKRRILNS